MALSVVTIKVEQMDEHDKKYSLQLLDELRAMIEAGEIGSWCYVATSATLVYNGGAGLENDPYRLCGLLDQTKVGIIYNYMMEDADE